jgi:ATP-dependent Lhr-like helicase
MREILKINDAFPYLSETSHNRLGEIRFLARNSGILDKVVTKMSELVYAVFPWVGTQQLFTLHYALLHKKIKSRILWRTCVYLEVHYRGGEDELEAVIREILASDADLYAFPLPPNIQIEYKYNEFIPQNLLRKQFIEDFLDFEGLKNDFISFE